MNKPKACWPEMCPVPLASSLLKMSPYLVISSIGMTTEGGFVDGPEESLPLGLNSSELLLVEEDEEEEGGNGEGAEEIEDPEFPEDTLAGMAGGGEEESEGAADAA